LAAGLPRVLRIEPPEWRRKALVIFAAGGFAVGVYLMYALVAFTIVSRPTGQYIEYVAPHFLQRP